MLAKSVGQTNSVPLNKSQKRDVTVSGSGLLARYSHISFCLSLSYMMAQQGKNVLLNQDCDTAQQIQNLRFIYLFIFWSSK